MLSLLIISMWAYFSFISFFFFLIFLIKMQLFIENFPNFFDSDAPTFINIPYIVAPILFDSDWLWSCQRDGATNTLTGHMVSEMLSNTRNHHNVPN